MKPAFYLTCNESHPEAIKVTFYPGAEGQHTAHLRPGSLDDVFEFISGWREAAAGTPFGLKSPEEIVNSNQGGMEMYAVVEAGHVPIDAVEAFDAELREGIADVERVGLHGKKPRLFAPALLTFQAVGYSSAT